MCLCLCVCVFVGSLQARACLIAFLVVACLFLLLCKEFVLNSNIAQTPPLPLPLPLVLPLPPLCLEVTEHRIWDSCHIEASGTISMAIAQNEDAIAFSVCSKAPCPVYIAHYCGLCILSIKLHSLNQKVIWQK